MSFVRKARNVLESLGTEANALRYFLSLQQTQWWSHERLKRLQEQKLRSILSHAYYTVPYYRRMFHDRNLKPEDFRSVEDLARLPITTKDHIRQNVGRFIASNSQNYWPIARATGGTSGDPLRYFIDMRTAAVGVAVLWRGWGYAGYRFGDKSAVLAGLSLVSGKENLLKAAVTRVIKRTIELPAINLRKDILQAYTNKIVEFEPKFIRGYPSSIYFFADFLKEEGISTVHPKAVLTTAEMLLPDQRELIEEVLQCRVFDGYGAFDGGATAFECEGHCGYHMAIERVVMEFVDDDGASVAEGQDGRIIATDLFNYAMPFIRYDSGDVGVYSSEECSCGRKLPLMKKILGRTTDILHFRSGVVLSGPSLTLIFMDFDIRQYQIVQTSDDSMIVKIVKGKSYTEKVTEKIYRILKNAVGDEVEVKFEFMDNIASTKSGKWKFVIREVQ